MSMRKKCLRDGHKFRPIEATMIPYVFCARWFCSASAVAAWAPREIALQLHYAIPAEDRYPPDEEMPR